MTVVRKTGGFIATHPDVTPAWLIEAYVRSELPLTHKVPAVFSLGFVVRDENPPTKVLIEALVMSHMRNVVFLGAEISFVPFVSLRSAND